MNRNQFTLGQELAPYRVVGYNYAEDHDNKIHSDEVASQYGFKGGLVPGVGVYAYLTQPVVAALGIEWLQGGAMIVKFLKPIYHGEETIVRATVTQLDPLTLSLEARNTDGTLCAVGEASLPPVLPVLDAADFPPAVLPTQRPSASLANLPVGTTLGSLDWQLDLSALAVKFLADMRATLPLYFGAEAVCHPAHYLAQANEILMANVQLGPWIHTGSEVQHYAVPRDGDRLSLRGTVAASFEKRGHEIVALELGLFAEETRPIALIRHTAIVRLRET
ncbi:MAG TPA: MaoC family dehydratase [Blastocatellia bacterium]|nr:MaoC family dehydratase [Blastocatellia bacterium]